MFDWTDVHGQGPFFSGKGFSARIPWFATATGRVGYAIQPSWLVFVKGGAAFIRDKHEFIEPPATVHATADVTRTGWTIGGGVDWMVAPNWSVSIEYGYMNFGTDSVAFQGIGTFPNFSENINQHFQVGLVSLNYRFGNWGTH
jgi:outer membrane immunogenic protein